MINNIVTLYTKPNCPECVKLKKMLDNHDIYYKEVDVSLDIDSKEFLLTEGHRSVPQLYVSGNHIKANPESIEVIKELMENYNAA